MTNLELTIQKKSKSTNIDEMLDKRRQIKTSLLTAETVTEKQRLEHEKEKVEETIADACAEEYAEKIKTHCDEMTNSEGSFHNNGMWQLKKKVYVQGPERLTSKRDSEGNIVTDPEKIK